MMAYSSIAQAGFMLLALFALNDKAKEGLLLYSAAYCLATIGLFGVLTKMEDYTIDGFNGLAKHQPLVGFATTILLLSLTATPDLAIIVFFISGARSYFIIFHSHITPFFGVSELDIYPHFLL